MIREAEEFADQDNAQRLRVEALNSFGQSVGVLKSQIEDDSGLGAKVSFDQLFGSSVRALTGVAAR